MRARPLTLTSVKPCTAAMLTVLDDGQWHPDPKFVSAATSLAWTRNGTPP